MNNKYSKLAVFLAVIFEVILIFTAIVSVISKQWNNLYLSILTIVLFLLPFLIAHIANKKKINLPSTFKFIAVVFIFLALYLGEINNFYDRFWWWDVTLHAIFGSYVVITSYYFAEGIIIKDTKTSKNRFIFFVAIFAFSFTVLLGVLWEIFEFTVDYVFKTNMVKGRLEDSATDLSVKVGAAFITSIYYHHKISNRG